MRDAVSKALTSRIRLKPQVVIAFSGGLDSTVACHVLDSLRDSFDFQLSAAHIHHGLSPNADLWADHCSQFADWLNLPFVSYRVDVSGNDGDGIEQAARIARYGVLDRLQADWIVLGHHADDQAETMLHNLARGSGVLGLAGMQESRGRYLRPLLTIPRSVLEAYAQHHGLAWIEDESNADLRFTRNYLRREVMPKLRARFPDFSQKSALAGRHLAEAQRLLNDLAEIDADGNALAFPFPSKPFQTLNEERSGNLLRALFAKNQLQSPPQQRVKEFIAQLASAGPDRHPEIRLKEHLIRRRRGWLELIRIESLSPGQ